MKKLMLLISVIVLLSSCDGFMPGDMAHIGETVEQEITIVEVKDIATLIENSNQEAELDLENSSYDIVMENGIFAVIEPDGHLLAICHSFEKAKEMIYEHSKLVQ